MKRIFSSVIILAGLLVTLSAHAWMDDWAPAFNCTPAEVEELPAANVSNFVCTVHVEDLDRDDSYWEHCEGYSLDLNDDGIKDSVYFLPWMGCGLAACGYDVHFRVSAGANEWTDTVIAGTGISKDDLVNVAGKTYFRHSDVFWHLEISKHNHWVYQVFSFDKQGEMICSNGDFGKLFPAVTIYYINPKFKRVELTKGDLKQIEAWTDRKIRRSGFDLLNYRYLFNEEEEISQLVINPASKKKEADDWKPTRKLSEKEADKLIQIMTKRFGPPARCRKGYGAFVYVWRFEGTEWLSVEVCTSANLGGDVLAIYNWEWRKPELSVYDETEMKERVYPIVQIEKEGLPPAAFFEFFDPYFPIKDGERDHNLVTEFNATEYLDMYCPRCTAEWDAVDGRYGIWTKNPIEWRFENMRQSGGIGKHADECHVGNVQFYKLAPDLYMCLSAQCTEGTLGPATTRYLFEVYEREIWSAYEDEPMKAKMVRYIGTFKIDDVPKFVETYLTSKSETSIGSDPKDVWEGEITLRGADL